MSKILFINSCARENSRTLELAKHLLDKFDENIIKLNLFEEKIESLDEKALKMRMDAVTKGDYSLSDFSYAKQFADADIIVIAAPFWDLSFPSVLKTYLEAICVSGITFKYSDKGFPVGLCKAKKLYYITTSGGYIGKNNLGFDYVKAVAENFFGIKNCIFYSAEGLDILGMDTFEIMEKAKEKMK